MTDQYALPVSRQYITPACRENRGTARALDEAILRLSKAYMDYADAPENADAHWHIVLYRVDGEAKAKLELRT